MQRNFYPKNLVLYIKEIIIIFFIPVVSFSQPKSNLEILYSLNDSMANRILNELPPGKNLVELKLNLGDTYSVFSNHINSVFVKSGNKIVEPVENELNLIRINIVLDNAGVEYGEMERDGWFGDYFVNRTVFIKGNYFNSFSKNGLEEFYISTADTVKVEDIKDIENDSFPFTRGEIPPEPFFSSLLEPIIAIGTAAIAVILFFSVRSK